MRPGLPNEPEPIWVYANFEGEESLPFSMEWAYQCQPSGQLDLPLTLLWQDYCIRNGLLAIEHDPRAGRLCITIPDFVATDEAGHVVDPRLTIEEAGYTGRKATFHMRRREIQPQTRGL